jgi:ABC-type sugar transport system substrate-binding protein
LIVTVASTFPSKIYAGPSAIFISPGYRDDIFFSRMESFMKAAAHDLGIDLRILYGQRNYATTFKVVSQVLNRTKLPDYLVLVNENDMGRMLLPGLSGRSTRIILINEGIPQKDRKFFGRPGEKYPQWFAEFLPDDLQAGRLLADELIRTRLKQGDTKINIVGLSGTAKTTSSDLRVQGLYQAVSNYPEANVLQVVPAYWDINRASKVTTGLLSRYNDVDIVWAASDGMALGAARAIRQTGAKPGRDILTGGIDWIDISLNMVKTGTFTATVGGHFMDGGWAMVMIYDDFNGYKGPWPEKSSFAVINRENVDEFFPFFKRNAWELIDFRDFSMILHPEQRHYHFSLSAVIQELETNSAVTAASPAALQEGD